jgi:hypothetical protein
MPTDQEIADIEAAAIARAKSGVTSSSTDGLSASFRSASDMLEDLEAIEKRTNRSAAANLNNFGLRFIKLVPPGGG